MVRLSIGHADERRDKQGKRGERESRQNQQKNNLIEVQDIGDDLEQHITARSHRLHIVSLLCRQVRSAQEVAATNQTIQGSPVL